jgi:hypothetical protein
MKLPGSRSARDEALASENLLEMTPLRVASWREVSERVVVERPRPSGGGWGELGDWLSYFLSMRKIRLDERGSFLWQLVDGRRSVAELVEAMRGKFGEGVEPAEERVGHLIRLLRRERLLAYPGWDSVPTPPSVQEREVNGC